MNIFQKIRFKNFLVRKTFGYTEDYLRQIYKTYLGHDKIIHYRNGHPVFSLSTPSLYSKPAANMFSRQMFSIIQNRNLPNLLSFAINDKCNANCKHCSFYDGICDKNRKELTLQQAKQVIFDAQELGVSVINFVGGEPLLRQDFTEIIKSVDKTRSTTIVFTNGWYLEQKAKKLKKAGLDSVYVSIDAANAQKHDTFRGKKGIFNKAMLGIKESIKQGLSVGISCTIDKKGFQNGELDRIIELGKKIGIHEVLVFNALPAGRYAKRKDLFDRTWIEDMIRHVKKYNQDNTYPGILVHAYTTSYRSVGCACGTSYFYISPYGDLMSCDFNQVVHGNVIDEPMWLVWDRMTNKSLYNQATWGKCKLTSQNT